MPEDNDRLLRVEEPFDSAVFLRELDSDLTFFHGVTSCQDPEWFERFFGRILREVDGAAPAVRLHSDHVLLLRHLARKPDAATSIQDWLEQRGFPIGPLRFYYAKSEHPIEDGFFTCICAVPQAPGAMSPPDLEATETLKWQDLPTDSSAIGPVLAHFMETEVRRIGDRFLNDLYRAKAVPRMFDMETSSLEFAASVWSANELRFWSRTVQYPK